MPTTLDERTLNRALLARQLLLERQSMSAYDAIEHLVGLQAQAPLAPYVGLWSRLTGFTTDDLASLLTERRAIRTSLLRGTIHLVTDRDALELRPLIQPVLDRYHGPAARSADVGPALAYARELVEIEPRTRVEIRAAFEQRWRSSDADTLAMIAHVVLPLVQTTPRGVWGRDGPAALTTIESWLGRPLSTTGSLDRLITRYLAAFGPASVADIQTWSGLTRLRDVVDRMRGSLRLFRTEDGVELYDLPDAPRPDRDVEVPPRFLPEYDNVLLSHKDRRRVIPDGRRVPLPAGAGAAVGTVLIGGRFEATWRLAGSALLVESFAPLSSSDAEAMEIEGRALLRFAVGEPGEVRISRR
jgi:Winged helix DNA-binding domain